NPYPLYERLRADPEPWRLSHSQGPYQRDFVLFSRYTDAKAIFTQHNSASKDIRAVRPPAAATPFDLHMLHRDGDDHLRLRKLVADFFSVPAMDELTAMVTEVVDSVLASWRDLEQVDLIADFAEPIPLLVVARLIG